MPVESTIDLFAGEPSLLTLLPLPDAEVHFQHQLFDDAFCAMAFAELRDQIDWQYAQITVFGKRHWQPRLSAVHGDDGVSYTYSGLTLPTKKWSPLLDQIKRDLERATGHSFNSVLLNFYRDQNDSMGWHSDDEAALGPQPVIASVSFGATREFKLKHKSRADLPTVRLDLTNGSLLLMAGLTQRYWKHAVDKTRLATGPRINLTFRWSLQTTCLPAHEGTQLGVL